VRGHTGLLSSGALRSIVRARVLGSAAAGGFPQWSCRCPVCVEPDGLLAVDGSSLEMLRERSPARDAVLRGGVDVAYDGPAVEP
jgi:hypothetical protein